jgi:branched-chain amino acid transport system ATP-binding protein
MLEIESLSCGYGPATVVSDLSLTVGRGEILTLLGPNGAGKTSTLMAIAGHVAVNAGAIRLDGQDLAGLSPGQRTRLGVGLAPEGRRIFSDLTIAENLLVGGYTRPRADATAAEAEVLELFPRLKERHRQRAGTLSGGEQQMLAIGRALMPGPRLLLIDELSLGLMPAVVDLCFAAIEKLKASGLASLIFEQNTHNALAHADRVAVLSAGRLVYAASGAEARERADLVDAYLGLKEIEA